jgi:hypothetical protein
VILGDGTSSPNVIEESLRDLPSPKAFSIIAKKTTSDGPSRVYDWLLDNEQEFYSYFHGDVPKILVSKAKHYYDCSSEDVLMDFILERAGDNKATILYLWNERDVATSEREVIALIEQGFEVKDITQGLVPFLIEGDEPQQPKVEVDKKDELVPFNRADYESMPKWTLDAHAKAQGINTMRMSKEEAINALLYEEKEVDMAPSLVTNATVIVVLSNGTVRHKVIDESKALAFIN